MRTETEEKIKTHPKLLDASASVPQPTCSYIQVQVNKQQSQVLGFTQSCKQTQNKAIIKESFGQNNRSSMSFAKQLDVKLKQDSPDKVLITVSFFKFSDVIK